MNFLALCVYRPNVDNTAPLQSRAHVVDLVDVRSVFDEVKRPGCMCVCVYVCIARHDSSLR